MRKEEFGKLLIVIAAIVGLFIAFVSPLAYSIRQGLDLQGGTHVVLEAEDTEEAQVNDDAMQRVVRIMEKRVNELGLTEPIIQRQGARRIIVELPGIKDPDKAIQVIGKTAMLEFKDEAGTTVLTGTDLKDAKEQTDQSGQNLVALEFSDEGGKKFGDLTTKNVGRTIAILLDGEVLTAPNVKEPILGGKAVITGSRTLEEAHNLAILLRSGALPVKVNIIETRTVGPTLGQDSKDKSEFAFAVGISAVLIFMLLFYRLSGLIADISLMAYVLMLLASLKFLDATLTLPGVAGIILSGDELRLQARVHDNFRLEHHDYHRVDRALHVRHRLDSRLCDHAGAGRRALHDHGDLFDAVHAEAPDRGQYLQEPVCLRREGRAGDGRGCEACVISTSWDAGRFGISFPFA